MSTVEDEKQPDFNFKFHPIPKTLEESFKSAFTAYHEGLVKSEPGGFVITPNYGSNAERVFRIEPKKDDVWLLTFPKCGTTWTSELLWLLMNDCDFETASKVSLNARILFPEISFLGSSRNPVGPINLTLEERVANLTPPRLIRPHIPLYLLHPDILETSKVVYVARNPKDVIVSYYFHHKLMFKVFGFEGDMEQFAQYFMDDGVMYAPFFGHILEGWNKRHHPNLHFMFYEDMKRDLKGEIEKVGKFLNKPLTEEQLVKLTEHLKFQNFEKNDMVNNNFGHKTGFFSPDNKFMRKGKTGDWKNYFGPELDQRIDAWIEKNLAGTDLKFVTELEHQDD